MIAEVIHKQGRWQLRVAGIFLLTEGDVVRTVDVSRWNKESFDQVAKMINEYSVQKDKQIKELETKLEDLEKQLKQMRQTF